MTMDEVINKGWTATIHPDDIDRVVTAWTTAIERRKPDSSTFDSSRRTDILRGSPLKWSHKQMRWVIYLDSLASSMTSPINEQRKWPCEPVRKFIALSSTP